MLSIIIPDAHVPFHCKRSWTALLELIAELEPDNIVSLGDFMDIHALTNHRQDPRWQDQLDKELDAGRAKLAELRDAAPNSRIRYIKGNHEDRWDRAVGGRMPAMRLIGLSLPRYLELSDLDIEWIEDATRTPVRVPCGQGKKVRFFHGHELKGGSKFPGVHATKFVHRFGENCHIGHTHKMGGPLAVMVGGKQLFAVEGGHIANTKHRVFNYAGPNPEWRKSIAVYDSERVDTPYPHLIWPR